MGGVTPKVSIGMPAYNDEVHIREAIDSLLAQTEADLELIVSDNASTDSTHDVCLDYAGRDGRVRVHRQPVNRGQAFNFNFVLRQARGEYFMWASTDDRWAPTFIETLLRALQADPRRIGAFCPFTFTDEESGTPIGSPRAADYSSPSAFVRVAHLCWTFDDSPQYGLFRRAMLEAVDFPTWWGINAPSPYDISIPPLMAILAKGDLVQLGGPPLMFKRYRGSFRHYVPGRDNRVAWFFANAFRQLNVTFKSLAAVQRGGESAILSTAALPVIGARALFNSVRPVPAVAKWVLLQTAVGILGRNRLDRLRGRTHAQRAE